MTNTQSARRRVPVLLWLPTITALVVLAAGLVAAAFLLAAAPGRLDCVQGRGFPPHYVSPRRRDTTGNGNGAAGPVG